MRKLVNAGLLSVDKIKSKAATRRAIIKYHDVLRGKSAALKAPTKREAIKLRDKLGLRGVDKTIVVPRHKGERLKISAGIIKGTRKQYGQTVKRVVGKFDFSKPPKPGEKVYYTIPTRKRGTGKLKRHTFSSFDEMLWYLEKYEVNFEDIEDYIEVEYFKVGSTKQKSIVETLNAEKRRAEKRHQKERRGK